MPENYDIVWNGFNEYDVVYNGWLTVKGFRTKKEAKKFIQKAGKDEWRGL